MTTRGTKAKKYIAGLKTKKARKEARRRLELPPILHRRIRLSPHRLQRVDQQPVIVVVNPELGAKDDSESNANG